MHRQPLHLAALAAAAVTGLSPAAVEPSPDDSADFATAVVVDTSGERWRVRSDPSAQRTCLGVAVPVGIGLAVIAALSWRVIG